MTDERPGAEAWIPTRSSLRALREAAQECRGCELHRDATQAVVGEGRLDARLVVVGEQPGDREDRAGEPFVGPAGQLLARALEAAGIAREDVFRTNAVKHFRFTSRRQRRMHESPDHAHVTACQPWLAAELRLVRPVGVVLLGATAGQAVYGSSFRVGASRGRMRDWPEDGLTLASPPEWVLATTHPAAVLRSRERESAYAGLVGDLRLAAEALAAG